MHRGELLAELCAERPLVAVAGTHGKTTTSAMIAHVLRATGAEPAFLLGGELIGAGPNGEATNAEWGDGEWVVAEADESDGSFLRLHPEVAVVTNVELDHHARWSSRGELIEAFRRFCEKAGGLALLEDPELDPILGEQRVVRFDVDTPGPELDLRVPGRHNVLNARAALAALDLMGGPLSLEDAAEALAEFPGVRRRLEPVGERNGARVYSDYAHHPTEVAAALAALRELEPRRLFAIFQPHLYSRTQMLGEELGAALAAADEVIVLDVYAARGAPDPELAGELARGVAAAAADRADGRPVWWLRSAEDAKRAVAPRLREGDVVAVLGAGDVFLLANQLAGEPSPASA
jgi:UDP-N-acetylmuramate--alanine ligase